MCLFELVLSGFLFYITIWEDALDALLLWSWSVGQVVGCLTFHLFAVRTKTAMQCYYFF